MAANEKAWKCVVCGFVHRGGVPPDVCPICGAPESEFESYQEPTSAVPPTVRQWRCLICGYVHEGNEPPDVCPVCCAGSDEFECVERALPSVEKANDATRIVIVGAGVAGVSAAESARKTLPQAQITLVNEEDMPPYYRLNLTRRLAGEVSDADLALHPDTWYEEQRIRLLTGSKAVNLDIESNHVELESGEELFFDKLILACGSHPFIPPIPGAEKDGVTTVRSFRDVQMLLAKIKAETPVVCIGGGILGLETAGALAKSGAQATLIEGFDYLLPRQLNREAAQVLERHVRAMGITIVAASSAKSIDGEQEVESVLLENGLRLPAEHIQKIHHSDVKYVVEKRHQKPNPLTVNYRFPHKSGQYNCH